MLTDDEVKHRPAIWQQVVGNSVNSADICPLANLRLLWRKRKDVWKGCLHMRLNPDCVRDVLLAVEDASLREYISPRTLHGSLPQYSEEEIEYTCLILSDGDYLKIIAIQMPGQEIPSVKSIIRLTFQGHEFVSKIRDPERWPKLKKAVSAVRDYSLSALEAIANGVTAAGISALFLGQN